MKTKELTLETLELLDYNDITAELTYNRKYISIFIDGYQDDNGNDILLGLKVKPSYFNSQLYAGIKSGRKKYFEKIKYTCRTGLKSNYEMVPATLLNFAICFSQLRNNHNISSMMYQIIPHTLKPIVSAAQKHKIRISSLERIVYNNLYEELEMVVEDIYKLKQAVNEIKESGLDKVYEQRLNYIKNTLNSTYMIAFSGILTNISNLDGNKDKLIQLISKEELLEFLVNSTKREYIFNGFHGLENLLVEVFKRMIDKGEIGAKEAINRLMEEASYVPVKLNEIYHVIDEKTMKTYRIEMDFKSVLH